jgi:hypothetical protein
VGMSFLIFDIYLLDIGPRPRITAEIIEQSALSNSSKHIVHCVSSKLHPPFLVLRFTVECSVKPMWFQKRVKSKRSSNITFLIFYSVFVVCEIGCDIPCFVF